MSNLIPFNYSGRQIRVIEKDGQPWWVLRDVCEVLELSTPARVAERLEEDEVSLTHITDSLGRIQETTIINESGLYNLILRSDKPEAKQFKRWITHEVIPSIRKHGLYATPDTVEKMLADPDTAIKILSEYKAEKAKRIAAESLNNVLMHVNKTYTATEIAKELGFKSAIAFNNDLCERGIQFKQNETWVLYSKYASNGYTEIKQEVLDNGKVVYHRKWTQIGREFLLNLYKKKVS